jgi:hypothetical protein
MSQLAPQSPRGLIFVAISRRVNPLRSMYVVPRQRCTRAEANARFVSQLDTSSTFPSRVILRLVRF